MTCTIELINGNEKILKAFKAIAEAFGAKLKVIKNEYSDEFLAGLDKLADETYAEYKKGKIKACSVEEYRKLVDSGKI